MNTELSNNTPSGILLKPLAEPLETLSHACECIRNKLREALKRDAPGEFEVRTTCFFRARSTNLPSEMLSAHSNRHTHAHTRTRTLSDRDPFDNQEKSSEYQEGEPTTQHF